MMDRREHHHRLPGYLAASGPGWGSPWWGRWLFELQRSAAPGPGRPSPPNDRAACPASSPVSVLLECDRTPLSGLLSLVPAEPAAQERSSFYRVSDSILIHMISVHQLSQNLIYDVVKLLLHFLLYLFDLIRGHREVRHLVLELLQQALVFFFLFLAKLLRRCVPRQFLSSTFGLALCFLKQNIKY